MSMKPSAKCADAIRGVAYLEIEHTADRALRICGSDLQELLINAAAGMNSLLARDYSEFALTEIKLVELDTIDSESLLVEWLSELAYWAETESIIFRKFDFHRVSPTHVQATIHGNHVARLDTHIKAVTYHNLKIVQTDMGLTATVVFDV